MKTVEHISHLIDCRSEKRQLDGRNLIVRSVLIALILIGLRATLDAGDRESAFLTATSDAVVTASSKWRTGEMTLRYKSTIYGFDQGFKQPYTMTESLNGEVVWNHESLYAHYHLQEGFTFPDQSYETRLNRKNPAGTNGDTELIRTPQFYAVYVKDKPSCLYQSVNLDRVYTRPYHFSLNPQLTWCNSRPPGEECGHLAQLTWTIDQDATTVTPDQKNPRRHWIQRDAKNGYRVSFLVDMDCGGMIVESIVDAPNEWVNATWDWSQDPHGVWYVKKWTNVKAAPQDHDKVEIRQEATISKFNSQPKIPANRFSFSSLELAKGTRISKITKQGKTFSYVGGSPPKKSVDLDSFIDDVQSGFAAPQAK